MGTRTRTLIAIVALLALSGILGVAVYRGLVGSAGPEPGVHRGALLVVPPLVAVAGLATGRGWGRWAGLSTGIAALPWAAVLTFDPLMNAGPWPGVALAAAALALAALAGRSMIERFEGRSGVWTGPRMRWLRWAMICNLASVIGLLAFVGAYPFHASGYFAAFFGLMASLLIGLTLLARQLTAGLLLVWIGSVLIPVIGLLFLRDSATGSGEMLLFGAVFLPGLVTGWATALVFGRPVWRFLRGRAEPR